MNKAQFCFIVCLFGVLEIAFAIFVPILAIILGSFICAFAIIIGLLIIYWELGRRY